MKRPTHLIPGTARKKAKCNECKKKIKVGDAYWWNTIRHKGTLMMYRVHERCR